MAFLPSLPCSASLNELAKIANSEPLHTPTMEFMDFAQPRTWQKEPIPNLADTPRTWQKKQELGRKGHELGRSSKNPSTSFLSILSRYYPLQVSALMRVSKKISHNPQSTGQKINQELWPDRSMPSIGRCGLNQRDPRTFPRMILLGLSFDALFSQIRREIQALCRFCCIKKQYFFHLERVRPRY